MERGESVTDLFRQTFVVLSQSVLEQTRVQERYNFEVTHFTDFLARYDVRSKPTILLAYTFNERSKACVISNEYLEKEIIILEEFPILNRTFPRALSLKHANLWPSKNFSFRSLSILFILHILSRERNSRS